MGKWKTLTLGEVNQYEGKSINPLNSPDTTYELYSVPSWDNNYPEIVQGKEIGSTKQSVNKNDVLLCKINPRINRVWTVDQYTENQLIASSEWIIIRNEQMSSEFLYYYLQSPKFRDLLVSEQSGIGGSLTRAQPKRVAMYPVPIPPLDVQQKIADVLDKASALIELRKAQLDRLDLLIKSQFIQMFGDPVTNPKGWPQTTVGDIAEIKIGPFGTLLHKEDYIENGHALVNPSHIIDGKICIDPKLTITDEKYDELSAYKLKMGDIVLGRRGEMGRCAVVYEDGLLCGTGSMIIRSGQQIKPYFLHNILSSPTYKKIIEDKAVGVTMMNLNVPIVSSLQIPLLPIDLQEQFISFLKQVDKSKSALRQSLEKIELNYKSLMQKCFRGEIF